MRISIGFLGFMLFASVAAAQEGERTDVTPLVRQVHELGRANAESAKDAAQEFKVVAKLVRAYEELRNSGAPNDQVRSLVREASDLANERERVRLHFVTVLSTADEILLEPGASPATPGRDPVENFHHRVIEAALIHITDDASRFDQILQQMEQVERQLSMSREQLQRVQRSTLTAVNGALKRTQSVSNR